MPQILPSSFWLPCLHIGRERFGGMYIHIYEEQEEGRWERSNKRTGRESMKWILLPVRYHSVHLSTHRSFNVYKCPSVFVRLRYGEKSLTSSGQVDGKYWERIKNECSMMRHKKEWKVRRKLVSFRGEWTDWQKNQIELLRNESLVCYSRSIVVSALLYTSSGKCLGENKLHMELNMIATYFSFI